MKRILNSIFAYCGWKPLFAKENFKRAEKSYANLITIEQQAIDFVHGALKIVNEALRSELKRNGYNPEDVIQKKIFVQSTATTSKTDPRFKSQVYSVGGFVVLRVNWKPNGFTLETNTSTVATANKKALKAGLEQNTGTKDIEAKEKNEVEVEALTNKKLKQQKALEVVK